MSEEYLHMPENPSLEELIMFFHAQPGVEYLICKVENQIKASKEEKPWRVLPGAPYAKVGDHECILMYRGSVIPGASPHTTVPEFKFDPQLPKTHFGANGEETSIKRTAK